MSAEITQLITYPIKSCAGISHDEITIDTMGLCGDRQWMLVDQEGVFLSQRKHPEMALIQPALTASTLELSAPGMNRLLVNLSPSSHGIQVTVWNDTFDANLLSTAADQWFSEFLGFTVHLVHYAADSFRQIDLNYSQPGQTVAFADGFPVLVVHQASLDQLNETLSQAVEMSRFRPNIVLRTSAVAWSELNWQKLTSGSLQLNLTKPCSRCIMTGIDQQTGRQTGTEVLKTLKQKFSHQDKAIFGINAIPDTGHHHSAYLKVGMQLKVFQKPDTE